MGVCGLSRMGFVVQTSGLGIARGTVQGREGSVGPGSFCWGSRRVLGGCRWRGPRALSTGSVRAEEQSNPALCSCLSPFLFLVHRPGQMLSFGPWRLSAWRMHPQGTGPWGPPDLAAVQGADKCSTEPPDAPGLAVVGCVFHACGG